MLSDITDQPFVTPIGSQEILDYFTLHPGRNATAHIYVPVDFSAHSSSHRPDKNSVFHTSVQVCNSQASNFHNSDPYLQALALPSGVDDLQALAVPSKVNQASAEPSNVPSRAKGISTVLPRLVFKTSKIVTADSSDSYSRIFIQTQKEIITSIWPSTTPQARKQFPEFCQLYDRIKSYALPNFVNVVLLLIYLFLRGRP